MDIIKNIGTGKIAIQGGVNMNNMSQKLADSLEQLQQFQASAALS